MCVIVNIIYIYTIITILYPRRSNYQQWKHLQFVKASTQIPIINPNKQKVATAAAGLLHQLLFLGLISRQLDQAMLPCLYNENVVIGLHMYCVIK